MVDMKDNVLHIRIPERMRDELQAVAAARYEGNFSLAARLVLRAGLDSYLYSVDKPQKSAASTRNEEN